ncbi:hypothetical protein EDD17DRAFT_1645665 [Pisolithus thermaeus]|nr:hypothetical protein EDD17DRAFT_1645665 [Pisolithus thermaeus]
MTTTSDVGVLVNACFQVHCDKCGKITWKGCGQHIDSVGIISHVLATTSDWTFSNPESLAKEPPSSSFRFEWCHSGV